MLILYSYIYGTMMTTSRIEYSIQFLRPYIIYLVGFLFYASARGNLFQLMNITFYLL